MIIYSIVNKINNKKYIGQTIQKSVERRYRNDLSNTHNSSLKKAIEKYGIENFEIEILIYCKDQESLDHWEKYYIEKYKTHCRKYGYNHTLGGKSFIVTEKTRQRMSESKKRLYKENPSISKNHSNTMKEKYKDLDFKNKQTDIIKKRFIENPEIKEKMSASSKKFFENPENRKKVSEGVKNHYINNPEKRELISKIHTERYKNEENRRITSEHVKNAYKNNPELIEKSRQAQKKSHSLNPDRARKQSKKLKECYDSIEKRIEMAKKKKGYKPFEVYRKDSNELVGTFDNQRICADILNIGNTGVNHCLKGVLQHYKGYIFKYIEVKNND